MIAIAIVNYRTARATLACVSALAQDATAVCRIYLLDNGSGAAEQEQLRNYAATAGNMQFFASPINLGFAGGSNFLIEKILRDCANQSILFLNSDALPQRGLLAAMEAALDPNSHIDLVAARLNDAKTGDVDSLGITLYRSTLASNRKRDDERLLGPSGGCALISRRLLEDLSATHGECFDETFFCYAEDTDLAIRARWLGYRPTFAAAAVATHERSLSSGGPDNDFVLYHGIRNSLWWLVKNAPAGWLFRSLPLFVVLHGAIVVRHLRRGRWRVLWRLYRDALKGLPPMWKKRRIVRKSRRVAAREFGTWVEPQFYESGYIKRAWRELWRGH